VSGDEDSMTMGFTIAEQQDQSPAFARAGRDARMARRVPSRFARPC
jgi:hypothetical protein